MASRYDVQLCLWKMCTEFAAPVRLHVPTL